MTKITVSLPDELVEQAEDAGLLRPEVMETLLREAIRKRRVDQLFTAIDQLTELEPRLTEAEITAEIDAARLGEG
jgi:hypothetical protein